MSSDVKYVDKQGFLHKMGFENPSWKKRFFVLAKNEIIYYGKDKDAKIQKNEKGRFTLDFLSKTKIKAVETGSILVNSNALSARNTKVTLKRPFLIEIGNCKWKDADLRTFYVSCENAVEREEWIRAFQHNCDAYLNTTEGKGDLDKIPSEGPRREAFRLWEEENKRNEEKAKMEAEAAERQARQKAMREEPWYQVHTLCSKGTLEELKEAVEKQSIDIKLRNPNGGSTLLQAATYGNLEIMRYLVDSGLDINGASNGGNTALHAAACMGFYDAAKLLLERGADRTKVNREGKTAAQSAKTAEIRDLIENWGEEPSK